MKKILSFIQDYYYQLFAAMFIFIFVIMVNTFIIKNNFSHMAANNIAVVKAQTELLEKVKSTSVPSAILDMQVLLKDFNNDLDTLALFFKNFHYENDSNNTVVLKKLKTLSKTTIAVKSEINKINGKFDELQQQPTENN